MSLKDLFNENDDLRSFEPITKADIDSELESYDYLKAVAEKNKRFLPFEEFAKPETFAKFGLAEKYYEDSIKRIHNTYPYDGSLKEKVLWEASSSLIDIFLLENGYPRTTGFATFSSASLPFTVMVNGYGAAETASYEFISLQGGPHKGVGQSLYYDQWQDTITFRKDANIFDLSQNRENNLKIDGDDGNTVEFWLKKEAFLELGDPDYASEKEVIVDVFVSGTTQVDQEYGRLRVELTGTADVGVSPWLVTFSSGTLNAIIQQSIGNNITTASVADGQWHHYAFIFQNNADDNAQCDLFIDGVHNSIAVGSRRVSYVSGALEATVGALGAADPPETGPTALDGALNGYAKLSGSLDELRYWKTARTSKKIQQYWFDQVGGGTNSDLANTDLGVYYKFNEGITGDVAIDDNVLDYSGRISNGTWTGYNALFSRSTGSAIVESSASTIEFRDPIVHSAHPLVVNFLNSQKGIGRDYDSTNVNSILSYVPTWMLEANETDEEDANQNVLLNLLQILSSYFDNASMLIDKLPSLSQPKYYTSGTFPPPFNKKLLESRGFVAPDIFMDLTLLEQFAARDNKILFQESVEHVKRTIYQNIYNNLIYLYKSKGTEKSFRNLIRCFGIDDEVLKFNIYTKNNTFKIQDNTRRVTTTKQYANFNEVENGDATVWQCTASGDTDATSILDLSLGGGSGYTTGMSFTLEADIILPNHVTIAEYATVKENYDGKVINHYPLIVTSSLFGLHNVGSTENDGTWGIPPFGPAQDFANFQVYTVKENNDKFTTTAKFVLTGTGGPGGSAIGALALESPFFEDVYDDQNWSVAVSIAPTRYGMNQVAGTSGSGPEASPYTVRFYGVNYISDIKYQSFEVSGTLTEAFASAWWAHPTTKRIYAGAHRTNFTGSLREFSDAKISQVKVWFGDVHTSSIDQHNKKAGNYGTVAPSKNAFLYETLVNDINIPEIATLALHWDFTTAGPSGSSAIGSSDASGQFFVQDVTSGSVSDNRYGTFSNWISRRYPGRGEFFEASSTDVVQNIARATLKQQVPEVLMDSNLTRILTQDDEFFNRDIRPITYHFSVEKNLFQSISEEMLDMFASIKYLNNLIGDPVNLYRSEYKELGKLRELFFEKVGNDYDFDRYIEYYKYIDYAIGKYIEKLIPASLSTFRKGITTMVENFVLDRNKYDNKFPIIKDKMPPKMEAQALGINELLYDWKFGHAPVGVILPKAIAFNGVDGQSQLTVLDSDSLSFGAPAVPDPALEPSFSWAAWLKPTIGPGEFPPGDPAANIFPIVSKILDSAAGNEYIFAVYPFNGLVFILGDANLNYIGRATLAPGYPAVDVWTHVCVTYDGSVTAAGIKIYVNGVHILGLPGGVGAYGGMSNTAADLVIGRQWADQSTGVYQGLIDEVAAFDKELTGPEVTEIYNSGRVLNLNTFSAVGNIVSWWRMGDKAEGASPNFTIPDQIGSNGATMSAFLGDSTSGVVEVADLPADEGMGALVLAGPTADQSDNCLWWKERAERTGSLPIVSSDNAVNIDKQTMLDSIVNETNESAPTVSQMSSVGTSMYSGSTYVTRRLAKPYKLTIDQSPHYHGGSNFDQNKQWDMFKAEIAGPNTAFAAGAGSGQVGILKSSDAYPNEPGYAGLKLTFMDTSFKDCGDRLDLGKKRKWKPVTWFRSLMGPPDDSGVPNYFIGKTDLLFPFSLYSSSVVTGYQATLAALWPGVDITNIHEDIYGPSYEVSMQGPFTEKYVGGNQWRHIDLNYSGSGPTGPLDTAVTRPEGWELGINSGIIVIQTPSGDATGLREGDPNLPIAKRTREPLAKRPVNIANILQTTGSSPTKIGNYEHDYDIVQTGGRTINNIFFVENNGLQLPSVPSLVIFSTFPDAPLLDYTLPDRSTTGSNKFVFANRFSAPGGPETLSPGFMDAEAAEFSVYNALPFRNLTVRLPLQELLTDHCKQFGYFSDAQNSASYVLAGVAYPGTSGSVNTGSYYATAGYTDATASFHKVNRNARLQPYIADSGSLFNLTYMDLDGVTDFLDTSTAIDATSTAWSWSFWLDPGAIAGSDTVISIGNFGPGPHRSLFLTSTGEIAVIIYFSAATADFRVAPGAIVFNEWNHVVFSYDGSNVANVPAIYINGVSVTVTTSTAPAGTIITAGFTAESFIGAINPGSLLFLGALDEVSFWSKALNAAEVSEIFGGDPPVCTSEGPGNLAAHSAVAFLTAWYRMGDTPGDTIPGGPIVNAAPGGASLDMAVNGTPTFPTAPAPPSAWCYTISTKPIYDNAYIQHQIPQTDVQYAWIKASLVEGYAGSALYGFEEPDYSLASMASTDLTFCSASDFGSYNWFGAGAQGRWFGTSRRHADVGHPHIDQFIPTDFVGLNTNIYEPITSSQNILGYPQLTAIGPSLTLTYKVNYVSAFVANASPNDNTDDDPASGLPGLASVLNSIILHRQGPYGWPSWKQIRGGEHPIARYQQNNNIIQYLDFTSVNNVNVTTIISTIEPPLSSKYKPLTFVMPSHSPNKFEESYATVAYGNMLVKFTDHITEFVETPAGSSALDLDAKINTVAINTYSNFGAMKALLAKSIYSYAANDFIKVSYNETIYPKGQYTYLGATRKRTNFVNTFWRDQRSDRTVLNQPNSLDDAIGGGVVNIPKASMWKLDAHLDFTENNTYWTSGSTNFRDDGAGELQNNYCLWRNSLEPGMVDWITTPPGPPVWTAPFTLNDDGCGLIPVPRAASEYARRIPYVDINNDNDPGLQARSGSFRPLTGAVFCEPCEPPLPGCEPMKSDVWYFTQSSFPPFTGFIAPSTASYAHPYFIYDTIINGDTKWTAPEESSLNYTPFYDSYDEYIEDLFRASKDATIVPEFRITEHIEFYAGADANIFFDNSAISWANGDLTTNELLTLTGSSYVPSDGNYKDDFLKRYAFSDFLEYFKIVEETYEDKRNGANLVVPLESTRFKIVCEAGIKFLPYDGFYPAERCVQLGTLFSESVEASFEGSEANFRTLMQPFFAPGIVYNSIKSGIAVDYPIYNGSTLPTTAAYGCCVPEPGGTQYLGFLTNTLLWQAQLDGTPFDERVPFEALYEETNLPSTILDFEPACRAHINSTASLSALGNGFKAAMGNFLAESVNTFLQGGNVTQLKSKVFTKNADGAAVLDIAGPAELSKIYSMDVILKNSTNINSLNDYNNAVNLLNYNSDFANGEWPLLCSLNVNSASITMYSRATTGYTIDPLLYGSSFGIPYTAFSGSTITSRGGAAPVCIYMPSWYRLASFEPYTPPYYDGFSATTISVELSGGAWSLDQIVKDFQYTYHRLPTFNANTVEFPNDAWANAMQMSASINLGDGPGATDKIVFEGWDEAGKSSKEKQQIIFSPKWECPILDFTDKKPEKPFYSTISGGIAKGMWHQYGEIPSSVASSGAGSEMGVGGKQGVVLGVVQSQQSRGANATHGDLAALLGFTGAKNLGQSLGTLGGYTTVQTQATKNTFSEAIVAIPFKFDKSNNVTQTYSILKSALDGKSAPNAKKYFNSNGVLTGEVPPRLKGARDLFLDANGDVIDYTNLLPPTFKEFYKIWPEEKDVLDNVDPAVYALLQKMHKYIMPPELDFLHNPSIDPFVMYMWEFEIDLATEDLQNIWQNIAPPLAQNDGNLTKAFKKVSSEAIEHIMPTTQMQHKYKIPEGGILPPEHNFFYDVFDAETTRWAVFKVKKRARNNYNNIIGRVNDGDAFLIRRDLYTNNVGPKDYPYSYNWPHDFYSLVELVKIETSTTFSKRAVDLRKEGDLGL